MSKIGVQIQSGTVQDFNKLMEKKPIAILLLGNAVGLQLARDIRAKSPGTIILIRTGNDWSYQEPQWTVDYAANALKVAAPFQKEELIDFLLPPNEPVIRNDVEARQLNDRQVYYAQTLKANGYKTGAYCFSVGNPDYPLWQYLQEGIKACDNWLFLHQYGMPTKPPEDLELRHRKVKSLVPPDVKIGITECLWDLGVDSSVYGHAGGYRSLPDNGHLIEDYLAKLGWWDGELAKDDYVKFTTLFGYSMEKPWNTLGFDVASDEGDRAKFISWLDSGSVIIPPVAQPFHFTHYPLAKTFAVSQGFGENPDYYKQFGLPGHEGVDYLSPVGSPVLSVANGKVLDVNSVGNYGLHITVGYADNHEVIYCHLSRSDVKTGDLVGSGTPLGLSGNSGNVTGPHLHLTYKWLGHPYLNWPNDIQDPTQELLSVTPQGASVITSQEIADTIAFTYSVANKWDLGEHRYGEVEKQAADGKTYIINLFAEGGVVVEKGQYTSTSAKYFDRKTFVISDAPTVVPPVVLPPLTGTLLYKFPNVLTAYGALGEEGVASAGNDFYRLTGATVKQGVSAFMVVEVYGKAGIPAIGVQVVNLFPDGHGEVIETDGQGISRFQFGASSAFSNPGQGPFTIFTAVGASKDQDTKVVSWSSRTSDIVKSLGDYKGSHTEFSIQFVQQ
jgi:hypothetical protein